ATTGSINVSECNVVLPIELIYLEAIANEKYIELNWATALEENFDYFTLERSQDGYKFEEIAVVPGSGSIFGAAYHYSDRPTITAGVLYYRLKAVDLDGSYEYSDIVVATVSSSFQELKLYPNPVNELLFVELESTKQPIVSYSIRNVSGKVILEGQEQLSERRFSIAVNDLPMGVYYLNVTHSSSTNSALFVVTD
ncbi:MAG: T9SS type A sorting domain-containing protein, partial [Bacteroidota bacterium]